MTLDDLRQEIARIDKLASHLNDCGQVWAKDWPEVGKKIADACVMASGELTRYADLLRVLADDARLMAAIDVADEAYWTADMDDQRVDLAAAQALRAALLAHGRET